MSLVKKIISEDLSWNFKTKSNSMDFLSVKLSLKPKFEKEKDLNSEISLISEDAIMYNFENEIDEPEMIKESSGKENYSEIKNNNNETKEKCKKEESSNKKDQEKLDQASTDNYSNINKTESKSNNDLTKMIKKIQKEEFHDYLFLLVQDFLLMLNYKNKIDSQIQEINQKNIKIVIEGLKILSKNLNANINLEKLFNDKSNAESMKTYFFANYEIIIDLKNLNDSKYYNFINNQLKIYISKWENSLPFLLNNDKEFLFDDVISFITSIFNNFISIKKEELLDKNEKEKLLLILEKQIEIDINHFNMIENLIFNNNNLSLSIEKEGEDHIKKYLLYNLNILAASIEYIIIFTDNKGYQKKVNISHLINIDKKLIVINKYLTQEIFDEKSILLGKFQTEKEMKNPLNKHTEVILMLLLNEYHYELLGELLNRVIPLYQPGIE